MKPTEAQEKEFWERYGFKESKTKGIWWFPTGGASRDGLPPIDPNNLFKYAVQKLLDDGYEGLQELLEDWISELSFKYEENALALFWALWQVKESEK